jgi:hypothetical protein
MWEFCLLGHILSIIWSCSYKTSILDTIIQECLILIQLIDIKFFHENQALGIHCKCHFGWTTWTLFTSWISSHIWLLMRNKSKYIALCCMSWNPFAPIYFYLNFFYKNDPTYSSINGITKLTIWLKIYIFWNFWYKFKPKSSKEWGYNKYVHVGLVSEGTYQSEK